MLGADWMCGVCNMPQRLSFLILKFEFSHIFRPAGTPIDRGDYTCGSTEMLRSEQSSAILRPEVCAACDGEAYIEGTLSERCGERR